MPKSRPKITRTRMFESIGNSGGGVPPPGGLGAGGPEPLDPDATKALENSRLDKHKKTETIRGFIITVSS